MSATDAQEAGAAPVTAAERAALNHWLQERLGQWREVETLLAKPRGRRDWQDARKLFAAYRSLARDVSLARREQPGSPFHRALERLYVRLHAALHAPASSPRHELVHLYRVQVPQALRSILTELYLVTALFLFGALAAWICINIWPDTAGLVLSPGMMNEVRGGGLWTDDLLSVTPPSVLSLGIMTNNIVVTCMAVALGLFFGFGTIYIMTLNGVLLGAAFAFTGRYGLADELGRFVVAHGVVEISVILLGGAVGAALGRSLARPGAHGRIASLRATTRELTPLLAVLLPALVICGFIEGYVSPNPIYGWLPRLVVGLGWWLVFVAILDGRMWERLRPRDQGFTPAVDS